jgi:hypothetical protein
MPLFQRSRSHCFNVYLQSVVFELYFPYKCKVFRNNLYECVAYEDNISNERTTPISQRSRSHLLLECLYTISCVQAVITLYVEGFYNNLVQMCCKSRWCVWQKNHVPVLKIEIILAALMLIWNYSCGSCITPIHAKLKRSPVLLTLTLLEPKVISLCHQYKVRSACRSVQSDKALYCWLAYFKFST